MEKTAGEMHYTSEFWMSIKSSLEQLRGLVDGFKSSACAPQVSQVESIENWSVEDLLPNGDISLLKVLFVQAWGDLYTIETKFALTGILNRTHSTKGQEFNSRIYYPHSEVPVDLRCSSFFKLLPDFSDIIFGHTSWSSFSAMGPRTFKHMELPVALNVTHFVSELRHVHFSASPGLLASLDDFYVVHSPSTKLVVIETTNDLYNPALFELVTPRSCLCWARAIAANAIAISSPSWASAFSFHASGTYTNQWQILDLNLFVPGFAPPPNTFVIAEEIPGKVGVQDATTFLVSEGYWASYNIPWIEDISKKSGNEAACNLWAAVGNFDSCWESAPRANIFRERQAGIATVSDMRSLMQFNDWQNDPLSEGRPGKSISSRRDLEPDVDDVYPSGGVDSKISTVTLVLQQGGPIIDVRMGPTYDQQPVFCWSTLRSNETFSHEGQPDCFEYPWVTLVPQAVISEIR